MALSPADQPRLTFNDGNSIPQLGLGVWKTSDDEAPAVIRAALDAGYRHIDTAAMYQNETGVGRGIAESDVPRDEVFVTTKLANPDQGYDSTLRAFDDSMARLGLDYLDLYLIHWPRPEQGLYLDTWRAFLKLKEDGRIRSVGVSNFTPDTLDVLIRETGVTPVMNQIELHPKFQQQEMRRVNADLGILTECWAPLGRGALLDSPEIAELAEPHDRTPAQIIIRWHLQSGLVVIPKSANPGRIAANFDVFDFELDDSDMAAIAAMDETDGRSGPDPATVN